MAATIQPGDTVRYLNTTGGGRVVRIEGQMAYIDEDGFETPVLVKECVVVARAGDQPTKTTFRTIDEPIKKQTGTVAPVPKPEVNIDPVKEEPGNEKLNVMLAFEPRDIKQLSTTDFFATLVNDSNYYIDFMLMTRRSEESEWALHSHDVIEPNTLLDLDNVERSQIASFEHIAFQCMAYKQGRPFVLKRPVAMEMRPDLTKLFKLHCFRENAYFDVPVLAFELVKNDLAANAPVPDRRNDLRELQRKYAEDRPKTRPLTKRQPKTGHPNVRETNGILEVDLHINELLDNTRGMSNADILNVQVDEFRRVMDGELKSKGRKIVFIHGKGEGVLRNALMKELKHRYKGTDVQDASFSQYGFGATQVTIR